MTRRFLVVFDTATKPEYYLDVLNLLALPTGGILRYEYRRKWIVPETLNLLASGNCPRETLFIYAQATGFMKGGDTPEGLLELEDLWIATRRGRLVRHVPSGDHIEFHFSLSGFPAPRPDTMSRIIRDLQRRSATPFAQWVNHCEEPTALEELGVGERDSNWQGVVEQLGRAPSQFVGDSFWRVGALRLANREKLVPRAPRWSALAGSKNKSAAYRLREDQRFSIHVASHTPEGAPPQGLNERQLSISVADPDVLEPEGDSTLDLRRYGSGAIMVRTKLASGFRGRTATIALKSPRGEDGWPTGPELTFPVFVAKHYPRIIIGVGLFAVAVVMGAIGAATLKKDLVRGGVFLGFAVLLVVVARLLVTGELRLQKP